MSKLKDMEFHSESDLRETLDGGTKKGGRGKKTDRLMLFGIIFLIALIWSVMIFYYVSYVNYSNKYYNVLININRRLKNDASRLNRVKTNLIFFKKVSRSQVNVSYILYLLSIRRFGRTYIKSLTVDNGRVKVSVFSSESGFLRSLNLMNDYVLYLNIYGLRMRTGKFRIVSLTEKGTKKNDGAAGVLASSRFKGIR